MTSASENNIDHLVYRDLDYMFWSVENMMIRTRNFHGNNNFKGNNSLQRNNNFQ